MADNITETPGDNMNDSPDIPDSPFPHLRMMTRNKKNIEREGRGEGMEIPRWPLNSKRPSS